MGFLTALTICAGLIGTGFAITNYFKQEEKEARLREEGKDPETLAKNQLDLAEKTSTENLGLQKEQFEYQKELNALTMQREDTAMQRQVADLKAAGLSPLMLSGGASATPLNSATAPQRDISGINQAVSNMIGAYNDSFNRQYMKKQFALQSAVSTAQAYTQLSELNLQKKKANLENAILSLDYKYYKDHPERNLGLTQVLTNIASNLLHKNQSSVIPNSGNFLGNLSNLNNGSGVLLSGNLDNSNTGSTFIPATKRQISEMKKDSKELNNQLSSDYQHAADILQNYTGADWQQESLNYFYRHTDAWRDYEHLSDFKNALLNQKSNKLKRQFLAKYPLIERKSLSWD